MSTNLLDDRVILVDVNDQPLGEMGKMEAHVSGMLHRAFSIFLFNRNGELLLQRRAEGKYHSAGLWTNTCCSHPRPGEAIEKAAERRLWEEMKLACDLDRSFSFVYRSELPGGLIEHELDHVFIGRCDRDPEPAPEEASEWRWASIGTIRQELQAEPGDYTTWFRICFDRAVQSAGLYGPTQI